MCEKRWGLTGSGVCIPKVSDKAYDCTITGRIKELLGKAKHGVTDWGIVIDEE